MTTTQVAFEVEQAGCETCEKRVRAALEPLGVVAEIRIDEEADRASVTFAPVDGVLRESVDAALAGASVGAGHQYRVREGSWREESAV